MAYNYVLLGRFHRQYYLACFVVDFDYFEIKKIQRIFRDIPFINCIMHYNGHLITFYMVYCMCRFVN